MNKAGLIGIVVGVHVLLIGIYGCTTTDKDKDSAGLRPAHLRANEVPMPARSYKNISYSTTPAAAKNSNVDQLTPVHSETKTYPYRPPTAKASPAGKTTQVGFSGIGKVTASKAVPMIPAQVGIHTVKAGDSLSKLAVKYGVSVKELVTWNGLNSADNIRVGQPLRLNANAEIASAKSTAKRVSTSPGKATSTSKTTKRADMKVVAKGQKYKVVSGDSISMIAYKHGIKSSALRTANGLKDDRINIGDELIIPADAASTTAPKTPTTGSDAAATAEAISKAPITSTSKTPTTVKTTKPVQTRTGNIIAPKATTPKSPIRVQNISSSKFGSKQPGTAPGKASTTVNKNTVTAGTPQIVNPGSPANVIPYVVMEGETLQKIADSFVTPIDDILKLNPGLKAADVKPGMKINIPPL